MNHFLGFVCISVSMICINQYFNSHFIVYCQDSGTDTVSDTLLEFSALNAELNPICNLLALLAHHILHVSRIRVKFRPDHVALYSAGSSRA
jgi:hypothetical protein